MTYGKVKAQPQAESGEQRSSFAKLEATLHVAGFPTGNDITFEGSIGYHIVEKSRGFGNFPDALVRSRRAAVLQNCPLEVTVEADDKGQFGLDMYTSIPPVRWPPGYDIVPQHGRIAAFYLSGTVERNSQMNEWELKVMPLGCLELILFPDTVIELALRVYPDNPSYAEVAEQRQLLSRPLTKRERSILAAHIFDPADAPPLRW